MTKAILFLSCLTDSEIDRISRGAHPSINPLEAFSINDLMGNDFVKIKGREVNGGTEYEDNTLTAAQFFGRLNYERLLWRKQTLKIQESTAICDPRLTIELRQNEAQPESGVPIHSRPYTSNQAARSPSSGTSNAALTPSPVNRITLSRHCPIVWLNLPRIR